MVGGGHINDDAHKWDFKGLPGIQCVDASTEGMGARQMLKQMLIPSIPSCYCRHPHVHC